MAVDGGETESLALALEHPGMIGVAQPRRRLDQRIENWLKIERRAADDSQHLCERRPLVARLFKFARLALNPFLQSASDELRRSAVAGAVLRFGLVGFRYCVFVGFRLSVPRRLK
jgi:hypothetical protein